MRRRLRAGDAGVLPDGCGEDDVADAPDAVDPAGPAVAVEPAGPAVPWDPASPAAAARAAVASAIARLARGARLRIIARPRIAARAFRRRAGVGLIETSQGNPARGGPPSSRRAGGGTKKEGRLSPAPEVS